MSNRSGLSDRGWGCLFIFVMIAISYLPGWCFFVGLFLLVAWMIGRYKQTGDVPDVSGEIDKFFTEDRRRGRKNRR